MNETPARHRARTGTVYRPTVGRALDLDEVCPTLFRYPGPVALLEALARRLPALAAPGSDVIWLCDDARVRGPRAARVFGTLAVLDPLRLSPGVSGDGFVAAAQPVDDEIVVWVPPRDLSPDVFASLATAAQARVAMGAAWEEDRARMVDALSAYLEEMAELARAGAPPPDRAWCEVVADERARLLAEYGVAGRFTHSSTPPGA